MTVVNFTLASQPTKPSVAVKKQPVFILTLTLQMGPASWFCPELVDISHVSVAENS
jgi:hypothetical protein